MKRNEEVLSGVTQKIIQKLQDEVSDESVVQIATAAVIHSVRLDEHAVFDILQGKLRSLVKANQNGSENE